MKNKLKHCSLLRRILTLMPEAYSMHKVITNSEGKVIDYSFKYVNPAFESMTGLQAKNIIGKRITNVIPGLIDDRFKWIDIYGEVALTGIEKSFMQFSEQLGKWYDVKVFSPQKFYFICVFNDITRLKENEKALKLNEARLESILKISQSNADDSKELLDITLNEAIKLTGSKIGFIFFYNEDFKEFALHSWSSGIFADCRIENYPTRFMLDKTGIWAETVRQRKPVLINDFIAGNPLKKGYPEGHVDIRKFLSIPVIIRNRIVAVVGVGNKETDYNESDIRQLFLLMDSVWKVLERKQIEQELIEAKEKAEASDKLKSSFLTNMSHEVRTPMNAIVGFSELLGDSHFRQDQKEEFVKIINENCMQLLSIINDIVDISMIESKQIRIIDYPLNIHDLFSEIYDWTTTKLHNDKIEFNLTYGLNYEDSEIMTDPSRLRQIIMNIVNNAIKFTYEGSINLGYTLKNNFIEFCIKDTGTGIAPSDQAMIFERFRRVESESKSLPTGNGLGLSISKSIIEMLGGKIWVESNINEGATFYFTIPYNNIKLKKGISKSIKTNKEPITIKVA